MGRTGQSRITNVKFITKWFPSGIITWIFHQFKRWDEGLFSGDSLHCYSIFMTANPPVRNYTMRDHQFQITRTVFSNPFPLACAIRPSCSFSLCFSPSNTTETSTHENSDTIPRHIYSSKWPSKVEREDLLFFISGRTVNLRNRRLQITPLLLLIVKLEKMKLFRINFYLHVVLLQHSSSTK